MADNNAPLLTSEQMVDYGIQLWVLAQWYRAAGDGPAPLGAGPLTVSNAVNAEFLEWMAGNYLKGYYGNGTPNMPGW